ncbi:MAG: helix-hairpin-helix domain-containing protein [Myxococcota bacterium]
MRQAAQCIARAGTRSRQLSGFVSVGPATCRDLDLLGVTSLDQLARQDPVKLYRRLCQTTGQKVDICMQDVFFAAVAQARDPHLPPAKKQWFYWSRVRKGQLPLASLPPYTPKANEESA